jgi:hypothetical protein
MICVTGAPIATFRELHRGAESDPAHIGVAPLAQGEESAMLADINLGHRSERGVPLWQRNRP